MERKIEIDMLSYERHGVLRRKGIEFKRYDKDGEEGIRNGYLEERGE